MANRGKQATSHHQPDHLQRPPRLRPPAATERRNSENLGLAARAYGWQGRHESHTSRQLQQLSTHERSARGKSGRIAARMLTVEACRGGQASKHELNCVAGRHNEVLQRGRGLQAGRLHPTPQPPACVVHERAHLSHSRDQGAKQRLGERGDHRWLVVGYCPATPVGCFSAASL